MYCIFYSNFRELGNGNVLFTPFTDTQEQKIQHYDSLQNDLNLTVTTSVKRSVRTDLW